jgi:hypothetical protein
VRKNINEGAENRLWCIQKLWGNCIFNEHKKNWHTCSSSHSFWKIDTQIKLFEGVNDLIYSDSLASRTPSICLLASLHLTHHKTESREIGDRKERGYGGRVTRVEKQIQPKSFKWNPKPNPKLNSIIR